MGRGLFQAAGCLEPRLQKKQFGAGRRVGWGGVRYLTAEGLQCLVMLMDRLDGAREETCVLGEAGGVDLAPSRNTVKAGTQQLRTPGLRPLHTVT